MGLETIIITGASLITACGVIIGAVNSLFNKKMDPLVKRIEELDMSQCRQVLIDTLSDIENNIPKNSMQISRLYELYDHYISKGGNSYIHETWERLKKNGKI